MPTSPSSKLPSSKLSNSPLATSPKAKPVYLEARVVATVKANAAANAPKPADESLRALQMSMDTRQ